MCLCVCMSHTKLNKYVGNNSLTTFDGLSCKRAVVRTINIVCDFYLYVPLSFSYIFPTRVWYFYVYELINYEPFKQ